MNTVKQWLTNNRLSQVLTVCLVGLLMVLNVACSAPKVSSSAAPEDIYSQGTPVDRGAIHDDSLDANNPGANARTRELIDSASKNAANSNKLEDLSNQARQSAKELPGKVADRVKDQKEELARKTERGAQNLKEGLRDASKEVPNIVKEATDGAKEKLK
jgi:gas vesicle protein